MQRVGPAAPNLNTYAERFAQSLRAECLDHFVICGEGHLQHLLKEYLGIESDGRARCSDGSGLPLKRGTHQRHHFFAFTRSSTNKNWW